MVRGLFFAPALTIVPPIRSSPLLSRTHSPIFPSAQPYARFVQIGRVCLVNYGPMRGSLVVVVNVVDHNRVLVEGPAAGISRQVIRLTRLSLTDLMVPIQLGARPGTLAKAYAKAGIDEAWAASSWGKKLSTRSKRANLSDYDRFKVMVARKTKSRAIGKEVKRLKKAAA